MSVLPLIDLMILAATGSLLTGFVLKAIAVTTHYRPTVLGFGALDFAILAALCLGLPLTAAARTWVKLNEPLLLTMKRFGEEGSRPRGAFREAEADPPVRAPAALAVTRARTKPTGT